MSKDNTLDLNDWDNLNISNNFIFSKVMQEQELCKDIINTLLELNIKNINCMEYKKVINIEQYNQDEVDNDNEVDNVELDSIYIEDEHNNIYNIEICTSNDINIVNKLMLYQHVLYINLISKDIYFDVLPNIYTMFICTFDICNDNSCKYYFQEKSSEDDNLHKIVFNTTSYHDADNNKLKRLLKYINGEILEESDVEEDDFIKKLDNKVKVIKSNKEYKLEYMSLVK